MAVLFVCFFKQLVFLKALLPFLTVLSPCFSYLLGGRELHFKDMARFTSLMDRGKCRFSPRSFGSISLSSEV